jgi:hypothetical protein
VKFPTSDECRDLNSSVIFHQGTQNLDDEDRRGPACVEIAGILVCVYLDPEDQLFRISAHFDRTDTEIICREDEHRTIPVEFTASGEVVWQG